MGCCAMLEFAPVARLIHLGVKPKLPGGPGMTAGICQGFARLAVVNPPTRGEPARGVLPPVMPVVFWPGSFHRRSHRLPVRPIGHSPSVARQIRLEEQSSYR